MIDKNYNKKFSTFFEKFKKQYKKLDSQSDKELLWDLTVDFVEKNRDFVMQYPISQYWDKSTKENKDDLEKIFLEKYSDEEINLYFHIPFCKTRCNYCNFHIVVWDKNKDLMTQLYITKLKKDIDNFLEKTKNIKIKTIFIWWWTPSFLDESFLEDLLEYINNKFSAFYNDDIEFSFEWNPDSFSYKKLEILVNNWVNRLSIWVQSFNDEIVKKTNRTYKKETVIKVLKEAKEVWFKNIWIDMIYWLPWHNYQIMKDDLDFASSLEIDHLTYYPLYYYDESILTRTNNKENNIKQIYDFYDEIIKKLNHNWFEQYWREYFSRNWKISHYQNNFVSNWLLYWFWNSAYSFNWEYAFKNEASLNEYLINNNNIESFFKYDNIISDKRLFVLWSRNIKIENSNIKSIENAEKIAKIWLMLGLINKDINNNFILTEKWLKYQEILAHSFI